MPAKKSTKKPIKPDSRVGQSYTFFRDSHPWDGSEVAVLAVTDGTYTVARTTHVIAGLLAKQGSPKRKLKTWTCAIDELY